MRAKTHVVFAIFAVTGLGVHVGELSAIEQIVLASAGSILPDIDHANSYVTNRTGLLGKLISRCIKHRGLTHSLLFSFLLFSFFYGTGSYVYPFMVGYLSHILLDMCTAKGVSLLYPWKKKFRIMRLKTGSMQERVVFVLLSLVLFRDFTKWMIDMFG
ncbi:MAG: metal-dependent hydrolase [Alkaliphilus sp.]